MRKNALILVAAGQGLRAGGEIPKQYREIAGKALLAHTVDAAKAINMFDKILVVIAADDARAQAVLQGVEFVIGGASRTASVRAGLDTLRGTDISQVFIHDGARPFLDAALISPLREALQTHDAAVPSLPIADAIKTLDGGAIDREQMRRVQTPQAFDYAKIQRAFDALPADANFADDIAVARAAGLSIAFTQGSERNFKVTYPEDFAKAEAMMSDQKTYIATGSGFDVHRLAKGDGPLWLAGVPIDCGYYLVGHSDADVGLHALTDAILGALADGDIGDHFPPEDPQWKGASSDKFLRFAYDKITARGGRLHHVDVTLICERPKIKPHRAAMRARLADILDLPLSRVSLKATTTEKLGFTGRGEGIAAQATATVELPDV